MMAEHDHAKHDHAEPPARNAKFAGYWYLAFLAVVLTGLAVWFVLYQTG